MIRWKFVTKYFRRGLNVINDQIVLVIVFRGKYETHRQVFGDLETTDRRDIFRFFWKSDRTLQAKP